MVSSQAESTSRVIVPSNDSASETEDIADSQPRTSVIRLVTGTLVVSCVLALVGSHYVHPSTVQSATHVLAHDSVEFTAVEHTVQKAGDKCSWGKQNCNATKCCNQPGAQCFQQSEWYAQCRESCTPGPDPTHWDGVPWSCKELGQRKEGHGRCSALGEDCRKTQCCSTTNTQCFAKNDAWATCKAECFAGAPDMADTNGDPWSCKTLGEWTKGASPWVQETCSKPGEDCSKTQCCAESGHQCYKKSDFWAQCKPSCQAKNPDAPWEAEWSCEEVGTRTPDAGGAPPGQMGKWVLDQCSGPNQDCTKSKCCLDTNTQCYEKNKDWAICMDTCTEGRHVDDKNESWSCKVLGQRQVSGLAVKGSPSLFCWSLFMTTSYEMDIMKAQVSGGIGIVECDDFALLSTDPVTEIGTTPDGKQVKTLNVEKAEITMSQDGTAGNAKLFVNCWQVLIDDGRWKQHAWMIKVDPDAVIVPYRVRDHLKIHIMENVYVVNCNKFPESPNFPMMYGSVEIYSFRAIQTYANKNGLCLTDMGMMLPKWGEDYYMTHCLDHIGVGRISDFGSVGDNVCLGGACSDQYFSAFHPYKSLQAWQQCWDEAHGKAPPPAPAMQWM